MINVSNIDELYSAVNNPDNADETIRLDPAGSPYKLKVVGSPSTAGRLELQKNMSLIGKQGDNSKVVIDTSTLPGTSFLFPPFGRTGAIRMGLGSNSISWLTIEGHPNSASGIDTDLPGKDPTTVKVAQVVSRGSSRGLDVRNVGAPNLGRRIDAEIVDNDFSSGNDAQKPIEAIRFVNFVGATGGHIRAVMRRNRCHDSDIGLFAGNNRSNSGIVEVRLNGDIFDENAVGCVIVGASVLSGSGTTEKSSTTFVADKSRFINNTRPVAQVGADSGGIVAVGADLGATSHANLNSVRVNLSDCVLSGNQNKDFEAFGARSTGGVATKNRARIQLKGVNILTDLVVAHDSQPPEPAGTNKVTVIS